MLRFIVLVILLLVLTSCTGLAMFSGMLLFEQSAGLLAAMILLSVFTLTLLVWFAHIFRFIREDDSELTSGVAKVLLIGGIIESLIVLFFVIQYQEVTQTALFLASNHPWLSITTVTVLWIITIKKMINCDDSHTEYAAFDSNRTIE